MTTTKESLEQIKKYLCAGNPIWDVDEVAAVMDEAIAAVEKQKARRAERSNHPFFNFWKCPACGAIVSEGNKFCVNCGQKMDWSK